MAEVSGKVDVLDDDRSASADSGAEARQGADRIAQVGEQEARVSQVERALAGQILHVALAEVDGGKPGLLRRLTSQSQDAGVEVDAHDPACGPHTSGEFEGHI